MIIEMSLVQRNAPGAVRALEGGVFCLLSILIALCFTGCGRYGLGVYQEPITEDGGDRDSGSSEDGGEGDSDGELPDGSVVTDNLVETTATNGELPREVGFAVDTARLPAPVSFPAATGYEDRVYIAGGSFGFGSYDCTSAILEYIPNEGSITIGPDLALMNQGLQLVRGSGGLIYIMMGYCGGSQEDEEFVFSFEPSGTDLVEVGSFLEGAFYFAGGVLPGESGQDVLVAAAGYGSGPILDWVQVLDPASPDEATLPPEFAFSTPRCLMGSAVSNDVLYAFGGDEDTECSLDRMVTDVLLTAEIVAVEVSPPRVEAVGSLPEPMAGSCAVTRPDGSIILFGGHHYLEDEGNFVLRPVPTVHTFEPARRDVEVHAAVLPAPRTGMACAITDSGQIYLFGGADEELHPSDEILIFEPYSPSVTLRGTPIDSGALGTGWTSVHVEAIVPDGTSIELSVRVGDQMSRPPHDPVGWITIGLDEALPLGTLRGRYLEWKADLTSSSPLVTPTLEHLSFTYVVQ